MSDPGPQGERGPVGMSDEELKTINEAVDQAAASMGVPERPRITGVKKPGQLRPRRSGGDPIPLRDRIRVAKMNTPIKLTPDQLAALDRKRKLQMATVPVMVRQLGDMLGLGDKP